MATETITKKVPKRAFCFRVGEVEFAAGGEGASGGKFPFSLLARSAQPITHWYWGKVVHDMAGFKASKPSVPVDYCHDPAEVLGFSDKHEPSNEGLRLSGELVQFQANDRVAEITTKRAAGVPYEASIFFDPYAIRLEELGPGQLAEVNGYTLEGPALIIREWTLRGVAICPYGADPNTDSQFAGDVRGEVEVHFHSEATPLKTTANDTTPANAGEQSTTNPTPVVPDAGLSREQFTAQLKRYTDRFGAENGTKWFTDGKSFEESLELHAQGLQTQLAAKDTQLGELNAKLAAAPKGETTPVSFSDAEKPGGEAPGKFSHLGEGRAKIAAAIKLPAKK